MPRRDRTFNDRDVGRIICEHLTTGEQAQLFRRLLLIKQCGYGVHQIFNKEELTILLKDIFTSEDSPVYFHPGLVCSFLAAVGLLTAVISHLQAFMAFLAVILMPLVPYFPPLAPIVAKLRIWALMLQNIGLALGAVSTFIFEILVPIFGCEFTPEDLENQVPEILKNPSKVPENWPDNDCEPITMTPENCDKPESHWQEKVKELMND